MKKFAAFDLDGTLIRWQLYHIMTDKLASNNLLLPGAQQEIKSARRRWKHREDGFRFSDYERVVLKAYEDALTKIPIAQFDSYINEIIEEHKDQVYVYTRDLLKKLKAQDYFLLAISGSHEELVEQIADYYGFDDYIGTQYTRDLDGFSGEKYAPSLDKKTALTNLVKKNNLSFKNSIAIGDSASDALMLELVENPIAFNPDSALFGIAKNNNWKIVLERKNMIYELESTHGNYILAQTN